MSVHKKLAYKILTHLGASLVLASLSLASLGLLLMPPQSDATPKFHGIPSGMRMIDFPYKKVGDIYLCKAGSKEGFVIDKLSRVDAVDEVLVPARARVQLNVNLAGAEDLGWLTRLGADNIESLNLAKLPVDSVALFYAAKLSLLKSLNLSDTRVNDKGLKELHGLSELVELNLNKTDVKGTGLMYLKDLKKIKHLDLGNNQLNEKSLCALSAFGELQSLDLSHCTLTDRCVDYLAANKKLEVLSLKDNPKITDRALAKLAAFARLRSVDMAGTAVSPKALAKLKISGLKVIGIDKN